MKVNNTCAFLNRKNNIGNHFQLSSFRNNQTRQKALCPKSLASLLLSHQHQPESDPVLNPCDLFWKVKTWFSQKRYGCVIERFKMRTNENSRSTADDGIMFMAVMLPSWNIGCKLEIIEWKCVAEQIWGWNFENSLLSFFYITAITAKQFFSKTFYFFVHQNFFPSAECS